VLAQSLRCGLSLVSRPIAQVVLSESKKGKGRRRCCRRATQLFAQHDYIHTHKSEALSIAASMKRRGRATTHPSRKAKGQVHPVPPATCANGRSEPSPRSSSRRLGTALRRIGWKRCSEDEGSGTSLTDGTGDFKRPVVPDDSATWVQAGYMGSFPVRRLRETRCADLRVILCRRSQ